MAANTKIEWTHRPRPDGSYIPGHTFNPWIGCAHKVDPDTGATHPGCEHCYAEAFTNYTGKAKWGTPDEGGSRTATSGKYWQQPLKWNAAASAAGERQIVFCASFADVFEPWPGPIQHHKGGIICRPYLERENTPEFWIAEYDEEALKSDPQGWSPITMDDLRRELFKLIDATPWLDWLLLTKRPENIRRMWPMVREATLPDVDPGEWYRSNVWLGTSISDPPTAKTLVRHLRGCRDLTPVLFLSAEPLLADIDLIQCGAADQGESEFDWEPAVDQIIVGCESRGKRVGRLGTDPTWDEDRWWAAAKYLARQCQCAGIAYYGKQGPIGGLVSHDPSQWPYEVCRVREFPIARVAHA